MKRLILLPVIGLLFVAGQVNAACINIRDTYSGIAPANTAFVAYGPVTVTRASDCRNANISSTITALGTGASPDLRIERLIGTTWTVVAENTGRNASYIGPLGTYRVIHDNTSSVDQGYSGTTRFSR